LESCKWDVDAAALELLAVEANADPPQATDSDVGCASTGCSVVQTRNALTDPEIPSGDSNSKEENKKNENFVVWNKAKEKYEWIDEKGRASYQSWKTCKIACISPKSSPSSSKSKS